MSYSSRFKKLDSVYLPKFTGTRVLLMPFDMNDISSLPNDLSHYKQTVEELIALSPEKGIGYLTIDEKVVKKDESHRVEGLHVDGYGKNGDLSVWARAGMKFRLSQWNEGKGRWYHSAAGIGGMITVSNPVGCRAWNKDFDAKIKANGNCEHLREEFFPNEESTVFEENIAYWCNAWCVHESLPMDVDTERTFVRLSMPSEAPWFEGYTANPKGVEPDGLVVDVPLSEGLIRKEDRVVLKG